MFFLNEAGSGKGSTLYHGSNKDIKSDYLKPKNNSHEDDDYVFATPDKYFALCYSGKIWNSKGMNLSKYNGKIVLTELRKDYISKTYNTDGYLYTVKDNGSFQKRGNLELLSKEPVEILSKEHIGNILKELESSSEVELYYYPNKPKWWSKVKGT
jgi:hypothetical protein